MQTETKLTARLVKSFREMGAEVLNVHGNAQQAIGWPDCFVCSKLWSGWIEFKGPKTRLEPHQAHIIKALGKTENIWIIRFDAQKDGNWWISLTNSNLLLVTSILMCGTDGQVAAKLLQELAKLDGY